MKTDLTIRGLRAIITSQDREIEKLRARVEELEGWTKMDINGMQIRSIHERYDRAKDEAIHQRRRADSMLQVVRNAIAQRKSLTPDQKPK